MAKASIQKKKATRIQPLTLVERTNLEVADVVKGLKPYEPVSSLPRILERPEIEHFKLDWNESTIPPSPKVKKAIQSYLDGKLGLNIYPQLFSTNLRLRLQSYVGYPADHILVTNGSDDALDLICKTYLNPGDRVLSPYPTYTHFLLYAKSRGAVIDKISCDDNLNFDLEMIREQITTETKIVYLVNPNNPTGTLYNLEELSGLLASAPHTLFLLDEAYYEFARQSGIELVGAFDNIVVTRSFSKAFGLAALRVGYMVGQPSVMKQLGCLYNPKSVNQVAQVAAAAALDDLPYYQRYVDEVDKAKELLERWCERNGLSFINTPGNFVMIRVERTKEVVEKLAEEGVYVRDRSSFPALANVFRLSVGTVEQTKEVIRRLIKVLTELDLL